MTVIEINESKLDKMSEYTEKMLKYGGKLMQCLSELEEESGMGQRGGQGGYGSRYGERQGGGSYGNRGGYGNRYGERGGYGMRDDDDDDEMWDMSERRGVRGSGRGRR